MYTVNIDAGGTMTDGLLLGNGETLTIKVDSTPHDLTVAMMDLLHKAGRALDYDDVSAFLSDVNVIRWSSTVTSNALAEQRGPKVGLLVDAGAEANLYGDGRSPALDTIIKPGNVIGITASKDEDASVLTHVRTLLEAGVRRVCVSFAGSFTQPEHENRIKQLIQRQYPDHYMGAVPVLLGHEMAQTPDDMTRTHSALINAYVHPALASSLFKAEDRLKYEFGWKGTLLVGHTNGGMARIGKTKALDTIESGPIFGTYAGAWFARAYGLQTMLCLDVGGTTAKCSLVRDGKPAQQKSGELFGIPLATPMQLLRSIALGGGSIVKPDAQDTSRVRVGPESMGASPGPACYGLGGNEATVTDCFVVLGYIDPNGFQGGQRQLDVERAREAIARQVAGPLGISVEEAALLARDFTAAMVSDLIKKTAAQANANVEELQMFAYGGNGPMFATFVADMLNLKRVYVSFSLGPIFSAFGTAISNIAHVYEHGIQNNAADAATATRQTLQQMRARACRDLEAEGFQIDTAEFHAELEADGADAIPLLEDTDLSGISSGILRLRAESKLSIYEAVPLAQGDAAAEHAVLEHRQVCFDKQASKTPVYDFTRLKANNVVTGPAVVSGNNLTCLVAAGWLLTVDGHGNGILSRSDAR